MAKTFGKSQDDDLTLMQKRFLDEYWRTGKIAHSARVAGYSPKTAASIGGQLLQNPKIQKHIQARFEEERAERSANIAGPEEVLEYFTAVMRGESRAEIVVVEGIGEGHSQARLISKPPDEKERLKAAEQLGKRHGLWTDRVDIAGGVSVQIIDDIDSLSRALGEDDD